LRLRNLVLQNMLIFKLVITDFILDLQAIEHDNLANRNGSN
jgi:hypothetical protein